MASSWQQKKSRNGIIPTVLLAVMLAGLVPSAALAEQTDPSATDTTTSPPTDGNDSLATAQTTESLSGDGTDVGAIAYGEAVLGPQKHATGITALGPDLFGEEVNTYTGGISFAQTDLSLPGNNALPVNVSRRLSLDGDKSPDPNATYNGWRGHAFGEWEFDLPYLTGIYAEEGIWLVSTSNRNARCSSPTTFEQFKPPTVIPDQEAYFDSDEFWSGIQLNVPGQGEQQVLYRPVEGPLPIPAGSWTALTTKDQWHFGCVMNLQSGQSGEGFLALAPDGTRYRFDWMVSYPERTLQKLSTVYLDESHSFSKISYLHRRVYRIYPTRIEDRFGNYVTYTYASIPSGGLKVTHIDASDGRSISFSYNADGQIASATAGTQTVSYGYVDGLLSTVTLPDESRWSFDTSTVTALYRYVRVMDSEAFDEPYVCQLMRRLSGETADLVMTHPSGAQGVFHLGFNRLYRTDLGNYAHMCYANVAPPDGTPNVAWWRREQPETPLRFDVLALQSKTLSGPGLVAQTWQYQHLDTFQIGTDSYPTNGTRTMTMVRPDGSKEVSVFGTNSQVNEGQLLSYKVLAADSAVLRQQDNTYVQTLDMGSMPFPDWMGEPLQHAWVRGREDYNRPLKKSVLQQQGVSFTSTVNTFDAQVRPTKVTKSSAPTP